MCMANKLKQLFGIQVDIQINQYMFSWAGEIQDNNK